MFPFHLTKTSAAFAALVLFSGALIAQTNSGARLSGRVYDALSLEPLIQAVVVVKSEGRPDQPVLSNLDGFYGIDLQPGKVEVVVRYVGYEAKIQTVDLGNQDIELNFALETTVLKEARVVADVAIERETPVAFSNIKPLQIQEELGSQPIPMILNSTPGVFASQEGSDDTGPSVTIRGFKQRNVSVMVDGIPVNSMETGSVFWNNWRGLDLVTETMQVQRGLGASKLALPAIGGTINIMTKGIESKRKLTFKQEGGSFGMWRSSLAFNTGKNEKGWGFTGLGSIYRQGEIYQAAFQESWFYYGKVSKSIGKHVLSFSALGSPATQSRRGFQQRIATLDPNYARNLFNGTEQEYQQMQAYLGELTEITNMQPPLGPDEKDEAIAQLNQTYGYHDDEGFSPTTTGAFEEHMSQTDFIDTTGLMSFGRDYNVHWGYLNRGDDNIQRVNERLGRSHQPLLFLRHAMDVSDRVYWSTTLYSATARVGSVRLDPFLGAGDYSADGQIDFDTFWRANTQGTNAFGANYNPDSLLISSIILREGNSNFFWLGGLSTVRAELSEKLTFSGGIDLRTYRGESYATVYDLLGGEVVQDGDDPFDSDRWDSVGDTIGYHNESYVRWAGAFGLLEYKDAINNAFVNLSAVSQGYRRVDYFSDLRTEEGVPNSSVWHNIPGYTLKLGGNRKFTEFTNAFVNLGILNRTPVFRNVFDFSNELFANIKNEVIYSFELGATRSKGNFSANVNAYYTDWNNRPIFGGLGYEDPTTGKFVRVNIPSMSALHKGIEADFALRLNKNLTTEGYVSFGDWKWTSTEDSLQLIDAETNLPFLDSEGKPAVISYDAAGVSVGDAPQTTASLGLRWSHKGAYIKPRYTYFARYYSEFDPFSLYDENAGRESWRIPDYGLLDIHIGYRFNVGDYPLNLRISGLNVLNTTYIVNAQNNDARGEWYYRDNPATQSVDESTRRYPILENNFDAASSAVYMGFGFRTNISLTLTL
jgi:hypothetical protein